MAIISPENTSHFPTPKPGHVFSHAWIPRNHSNSLQPETAPHIDSSHADLMAALERGKNTVPEQYSEQLDLSTYNNPAIGGLIRTWNGEGQHQEQIYLDEAGNQLSFDILCTEDQDVRLKINLAIKKLLLNGIVVAEIKTFHVLGSENDTSSPIAKKAMSDPDLTIVGRNKAEFTFHKKLVQKKLSEIITQYSKLPESKALDKGSKSDLEFAMAVLQLFTQSHSKV